jgi:glutaredoxin
MIHRFAPHPLKRQSLKMGTWKALAVFSAAALLVTMGAQAQTVYRIVGADGRVTFSDKPPVSSDNVTATGRGGKALELGNGTLPFELRQVTTRYPVTIYTSANCAPCGAGRNLLSNRGVPFTERTINTAEDTDALIRISGENALPFLTIGGQKIKGFADAEWTQFLDAAGCPAGTKLPGNYRNPPAAPLVAVQKPSAEPKPAEAGEADTAKAPAPARPAPVDTSSNPAGIKF